MLRRLKILWAFIVKDLKDLFRFRVQIFSTFLHPFLTMISFLVVYASIFIASDTDDLGFVQEENYVIYVLTGFLAYSIFILSWGRTSLRVEKIMLTLQGMLLAPVNRLYILGGKAFQAFVEIVFSAIIFVFLIALLQPSIDWSIFGYGVIGLVLLFVIFIGADFIISSLEIAHEGWAGLIRTYAPRAFLILGAVYFPSDVIPAVLKPLVYINPLFHAVNLFRGSFGVEAELPFGEMISFLYLLTLAIVIIVNVVVIFEYMLNRWGIRGY